MCRRSQQYSSGLDKSKHYDRLIPTMDGIVVDQMWQLGLSHLINVPSVEIPHTTTGGFPRKLKQLATSDSAVSI